MYQFLRNVTLSGLLLLIFWAGTSKFGGSPGGKTGSPIDGSNCTGCHSGSDIINKDNWITTNIPASGYVPGSTYEIKIKANHQGSNRIGFEITSENATKKVGLWQLVDSVNTQYANDSVAVTHTSKGSSAADSVSWTMEWKAPLAGTGDVTFYAAINATNSDLSSSGDQVYLTSTTVIETGTTNLSKLQNLNKLVRLWPNPTRSFLNIEFKHPAKIKMLELVNSQGRIIKRFQNFNKPIIYLDKIPTGIFYLRMYIDNKIIIKTFLKI